MIGDIYTAKYGVQCYSSKLNKRIISRELFNELYLEKGERVIELSKTTNWLGVKLIQVIKENETDTFHAYLIREEDLEPLNEKS